MITLNGTIIIARSAPVTLRLNPVLLYLFIILSPLTAGITRNEHSGEKFYFAKHRRWTRNLQRIGRVRFLVHTIVMRAAYPMHPLA